MREKLPSRTMTMMVTVTGMLVVMLIFMMGSVLAEQTLKTVEVPAGYVALPTSAGSPYVTTLNIDPPDGVQQIYSFELVVTGDFQSSTGITAKVRKFGGSQLFDCTPTTWTTPSIDTPSYQVVFDCTSLVKNFSFTTGKIDAGFAVDKTAQNVHARARMTYYNKPEVALSVFGTEYEINDQYGKVFLQLLDDQHQAITNATCFSSIYYPNGTGWKNETLMSYLDEGLHFYDIAIPSSPLGVYMVSAFCAIPENLNTTTTEDFETGDFTGGTNWYTAWSTDCSVSSGNAPIGNYHMLCQSDDQTAQRGVDMSSCTTGYVTFWAKSLPLDAGDYCNMTYYNGTEYFTLQSFSLGNQDDNVYRYYSYEVCNTYGGSLNSAFNVTTTLDNPPDDCYVDNISIVSIESFNVTEYQFVRGSGELHVTDGVTNLSAQIYDVPANVWNYTNRNLTYINFTEVLDRLDEIDVSLSGNFSEILNYLSVINGTVHLTNDTVFNIWGYQMNELANNLTEMTVYLQDINDTAHGTYNWVTGMVNLSSYDVWNYTERLLTDADAVYVGGTEYSTGEEAQYIVQILKTTASGTTPINNATCNLDAYFPNATLAVSGLNMTYITGSNGIYRANKTIDHNDTGVFFVDVTCSDGVKTYHTSGTGHVSEWANKIRGLENLTAEDVWNYEFKNLTYFNYTPITDYIDDLNVSNQNRYDILNATIMNELYSMNGTLDQIRQDINDTNSSILLRLDQHNGTIMTKLYLMQGEIASVNDSVNALANLTAFEVWNYAMRNLTFYPDPVNYSLVQDYVWNSTNRTLTELNFTAEINDTDILNAISATNSSLYQAIVDSNSSVLQAIIDSNTSIIGQMSLYNNTIMLKLYSIGTQIANLNDLSASEVWSFGSRTLTDYNQTELLNLLNTINDSVYNLTIGNVTVSASVNWTEGAVKMSDISDPIIVESQLLTFAGRDQTPVETISRSYCLDNGTLGYDRNTTRCWLDQCYTVNDTLTEICEYGCYQGACNPEPFDRITFLALIFLFVIVVIVLLAFAYDRFVK